MKLNNNTYNREKNLSTRLEKIILNQKNNIATIFLVASFLLSNNLYAEGDKTIEPGSKKEIVSENTKELIKELLTNRTLQDLSDQGNELQEKREKNYLGINEEWNIKFNGDMHRKRLIEGFSRMIEEGHLDMIVDKLKQNNIPLEILFLAIAESYREADIISPANAKGFWQFIEASAKMFGAIDENGNDFRSDPEISTDAAIRHLKANYNTVSLWAKSNNISTREEDKWMFAMYLYNGGPKLIKKAFIESEGDANKYPSFQKSNENKNYVPRILAIRNVLYELVQKYDFNIEAMKNHRVIECCYKERQSKTMLEDYYKSKDLFDYLSKTKEVLNIIEQLKIDYNNGLMPYEIFIKTESELKQELLNLQDRSEEI